MSIYQPPLLVLFWYYSLKEDFVKPIKNIWETLWDEDLNPDDSLNILLQNLEKSTYYNLKKEQTFCEF